MTGTMGLIFPEIITKPNISKCSNKTNTLLAVYQDFSLVTHFSRLQLPPWPSFTQSPFSFPSTLFFLPTSQNSHLFLMLSCFYFSFVKINYYPHYLEHWPTQSKRSRNTFERGRKKGRKEGIQEGETSSYSLCPEDLSFYLLAGFLLE